MSGWVSPGKYTVRASSRLRVGRTSPFRQASGDGAAGEIIPTLAKRKDEQTLPN